MLKVNKGFLFDLQRLIDKYKPTLVVSGSLIQVMKKLLETYKSPLFGRFDFVIKLNELDFRTITEICMDMGLDTETALKLYSVFGGVPKYYELLEKLKEFDIENFVIQAFVTYPRPLYEEVRTMLKEEFGGEHKMFFSILSAIAQGNTRLSEIANFVGREQTKITKYLDLLKNDFELISHEFPATGGKRGIYSIKSSLISFWFSNIWRYQELIERGEEGKLEGILRTNINSWFGKAFEKVVSELIKSGAIELPFKPTSLGRQWGNIPKAEKGKNTYEIDLVCLDEPKKEALFVECKWSDLTEKKARQILEELREKSKFVDWERTREYFGLIGKKIQGKETLRKEGFWVWDLGDFGKALK